MTQTYFALLTNIGAAKIANATALGTTVNITKMAVGDGNGATPTPDPAQTALVNEKNRQSINSLSIDPNNPNQIIAEQVLTEDIGGWWIREIGLFDDNDDLIAVGNCPPSYKPILQEGSGREQVIRMILIVSSTDAVTLKIDPSVILATKEYVDNAIEAHAKSRNHPDATLTEKGFVQLSSTINDDENKAVTPKAIKIALASITPDKSGSFPDYSWTDANFSASIDTLITPDKHGAYRNANDSNASETNKFPVWGNYSAGIVFVTNGVYGNKLEYSTWGNETNGLGQREFYIHPSNATEYNVLNWHERIAATRYSYSAANPSSIHDSFYGSIPNKSYFLYPDAPGGFGIRCNVLDFAALTFFPNERAYRAQIAVSNSLSIDDANYYGGRLMFRFHNGDNDTWSANIEAARRDKTPEVSDQVLDDVRNLAGKNLQIRAVSPTVGGTTLNMPPSGYPYYMITSKTVITWTFVTAKGVDGSHWEIIYNGDSGQWGNWENKSVIPAGSPIPWPSQTIPAGYLKCNGQSFSTTTYPQLAIAYPSGVLPDLRAAFIRGLDDGKGVDIGRVIGSEQDDAFQGHGHRRATFRTNKEGNTTATIWSFSENFNGTANFDSLDIITDGTHGTPRVTAETRPRNIAFNYIVRAA